MQVNHEKLVLTPYEVEYFRGRLSKINAKSCTSPYVLKHNSPKRKLNLQCLMQNVRRANDVGNSGGSFNKKRRGVSMETKKVPITLAPKLVVSPRGKVFLGKNGYQKLKQTKLNLRCLTKRGSGIKLSKHSGAGNGSYGRRACRQRNRHDVYDTDSDNNVSDQANVFEQGFSTPPPEMRGNCSSDEEALKTPKTADLMDTPDSDGVPRGCASVARCHGKSPPCCTLFADDMPTVPTGRLAAFEADNSRLILALQGKETEVHKKETEIMRIKAHALSECEKYRAEMISVKALAGRMKIAIAEVKDSTQSVIETVSSECTKLAQECNRLKAIISKQRGEIQQLNNNVTQFANDKVQLTSQIHVLEDRLSVASSAGKAYVFDMEAKFDELALKYNEAKGTSRSLLNEERALAIKKDQKIDALSAAIHENELLIRNLRSQLSASKFLVQDLQYTPMLGIFDHPEVVGHLECVELLQDASKVITAMGDEIEDADRTIVEQAGYIERMQLVPYSPVTLPVTPMPGRASPVCAGPLFEPGECSTAVPFDKKKRNRLTVSPGSITRAIKQRTEFRVRVPKKLSSSWDVGNAITIADSDDEVIAATEPVNRVPFPNLDTKWTAVRKMKPEILALLKECWVEGGPSAEVIKSGPYGLGVVTTERCVGLLHHESIDDCMVDGWVYTAGNILSELPDFAKVHTFPARVFGLVNTHPHPIHLKRWVDEAMASALECQVLLFPINAPASLYSKAEHGFHWTLLRYNVARNEWFFYNSMPSPAEGVVDVYQVQAKKIVLYAENVMKRVLRETTPCHALLVDGRAPSDPTIVETCRQESGSFDCGIVVCNLIELFMRGKPVKRGAYNKLIAGVYRKKMVEWFLDPESAI